MRIAAVNAGSSSVKAALAEVDAGEVRVLERVRENVGREVGVGSVVERALDEVGARPDHVDAVAHRVVHGGRRFTEPTVIDAEVERAIDELGVLAPLHNPPALEGVRNARRALPGAPMVAVFDTSFHADRSAESMRYAVPWDIAEELGLWRYGFHGIAHASLVESLAEAQRVPAESVTAITLQLGAGCSACAVLAGRSMETSMGYSPLEGLVMATRSGNVDASVVLELLRQGNDIDAVRDLLTRESGLAGVAGTADMRLVLEAEAAGDERARVAVALFVRRIVATVGAYWTLLGGEGALVFGGGVGTGSGEIRRRIAEGLGAWDVELDPARNESGGPGSIGTPASRPIYVFETDEERLLARAAYDTLLR